MRGARGERPAGDVGSAEVELERRPPSDAKLGRRPRLSLVGEALNGEPQDRLGLVGTPAAPAR